MEKQFFLEYWTHTALNVGQACRDVRYFYYHPEADSKAKAGSVKHYCWSFQRRIQSVANNVFYSIIPPHWHHSKSDLEGMVTASAKEWFFHGYAPWDNPDPYRELLALLKKADADPLLAGFVFPEDKSKKRLKIFDGKNLVGFATPRRDHDDVWRMGAIYVSPEFRNRGLAKKAIANFMKDKRGRAFIENDNLSSQHAYRSAGFQIKSTDPKNEGSWWENF